MTQIFLLPAQRAKLLENGTRTAEDGIGNHVPVVKFFTPDGNCTWLITDLSPDDGDTAFGLCDVGPGFPELGCVSLSELQSIRGKFGLPVERDIHFIGKAPIGQYAQLARAAGYIVQISEEG